MADMLGGSRNGQYVFDAVQAQFGFGAVTISDEIEITLGRCTMRPKYHVSVASQIEGRKETL